MNKSARTLINRRQLAMYRLRSIRNKKKIRKFPESSLLHREGENREKQVDQSTCIVFFFAFGAAQRLYAVVVFAQAEHVPVVSQQDGSFGAGQEFLTNYHGTAFGLQHLNGTLQDLTQCSEL